MRVWDSAVIFSTRSANHKVKRLLENPRYTGQKGYPAIIDAETFQAVQRMIQGKTAGYAPPTHQIGEQGLIEAVQPFRAAVDDIRRLAQGVHDLLDVLVLQQTENMIRMPHIVRWAGYRKRKFTPPSCGCTTNSSSMRALS